MTTLNNQFQYIVVLVRFSYMNCVGIALLQYYSILQMKYIFHNMSHLKIFFERKMLN